MGMLATESVRQAHLDALGEDLGPVYHALYNEVVWLHAKWLEYRKLFGQAPERVELLNRSAPFFFHVAQDVFWNDALMHVARLTDPASQGDHENLSLLQLPALIDDEPLAARVSELVSSAVLRADFARTYRNKRLAHSDLGHALNEGASPLSGGSRRDIEEVLSAFTDVLNVIYREFFDSDVLFREFVSGGGDGNALVYHLAAAEHYESGRRQRVMEGKSIPEDTQHPTVP